ncbi:MAG: hypothetical protein J7513_10060 [Solirubrobacteraceae bacterium]|nr:hypothetical protein [Solirubrobacteraceae bacterium]
MALAAIVGVASLYVTFVWSFLAAGGLDPACGEGRTLGLVLLMIATAPIWGAAWSAVAGMLYTAVRNRSPRKHLWLLGPAVAAAFALFAGFASQPARPAEPGECPRFDMSVSSPDHAPTPGLAIAG